MKKIAILVKYFHWDIEANKHQIMQMHFLFYLVLFSVCSLFVILCIFSRIYNFIIFKYWNEKVADVSAFRTPSRRNMHIINLFSSSLL